MTLVFGAQEVMDLCKMDQLVDDLDAASREEAAGQVVMPPRTTLAMDAGGFRMMPVILNGSRLFGFKVFHWTSAGARYLVALYSQDGGELVALVDGD
jgi:ornithine cyclodeaminase/alanine dehydrogenase-like protein (mu-crystallin family)